MKSIDPLQTHKNLFSDLQTSPAAHDQTTKPSIYPRSQSDNQKQIQQPQNTFMFKKDQEDLNQKLGLPLGQSLLTNYNNLAFTLSLYKDGLYYGPKISDFPHGVGLFYYKNGNFYIGSFHHGYPHGVGYLYFASGGFYYGEIKAGLAEGQGLYNRPSADFYFEGAFEAGEMNGRGYLNYRKLGYDVLMTKNKISYSSLRKAKLEELELPEIMTSQNDEYLYLRYVHCPESKAQFTQAGMEFVATRWNKIYFGEKVGGKREGVGSILRSNGSRYHGMFHNNEPLGLGLFVTLEGGIEFGFFLNKRKEIFGVDLTADHESTFGCFRSGLLNGPAIVYKKNLKRWILGNFSEGERVSVKFTREGELPDKLWNMEELLEPVLECAFGGFQKIDQSLGKFILNEFLPNTDSINLDLKLSKKYIDKEISKFLLGEEKFKKRIFGKEWQNLKEKRKAGISYEENFFEKRESKFEENDQINPNLIKLVEIDRFDEIVLDNKKKGLEKDLYFLSREEFKKKKMNRENIENLDFRDEESIEQNMQLPNRY